MLKKIEDFFLDVNSLTGAEKFLNKNLEDFFVRNKNNENGIYMQNLPIFREIASSFVKHGKAFFAKHDIKPMNPEITIQCDNLEKVQLVDAFYKRINVNADATSLYKKGTIVFEKPEISTEKQSKGKPEGIVKKDSFGNISVTVTDNGLLTDSVTLVHELSHYMNTNPNIDGTTVSKNLLGEALADAYKLLFADYLAEKGFTYESDCIKLISVKNLFEYASNALSILKVLATYDVYGEVSFEKYTKLFSKNIEEYKTGVTSLADHICSNGEKYIFIALLRYMVDFGLSVYMYTQYKKDHSFGEKLKKLNDAIAKSNDYDRCLKMIDIKSKYYPNDDSICYICSANVLEAIDEYCKDLEAILQRNPSMQNDVGKGITI